MTTRRSTSSDLQEPRLLLRAEVLHAGKIVIAHTLELSETEVVVRTDQPPAIGEDVTVRLSFPRLVAPLQLHGRVVDHSERAAPGEHAGMTVQLRFRSDEERNRLRLLLARVARGTTIPPSEAAQLPACYRVLLVEDNSMIREMFVYGVKKYFRSRESNVAVDVACDGEEAWRMLQDARYDLAIVDFYLPVLNGSQLISRMRSAPDLSTLPVVVISVGGPEARDESLAVGADMFLDKPIVLRDLFWTLERLIARGAET